MFLKVEYILWDVVWIDMGCGFENVVVVIVFLVEDCRFISLFEFVMIMCEFVVVFVEWVFDYVDLVVWDVLGSFL